MLLLLFVWGWLRGNALRAKWLRGNAFGEGVVAAHRLYSAAIIYSGKAAECLAQACERFVRVVGWHRWRSPTGLWLSHRCARESGGVRGICRLQRLNTNSGYAAVGSLITLHK